MAFMWQNFIKLAIYAKYEPTQAIRNIPKGGMVVKNTQTLFREVYPCLSRWLGHLYDLRSLKILPRLWPATGGIADTE